MKPIVPDLNYAFNLSYKPNDHYAQKARKEKFVARSIYKLEEIDQRFHIIKPGNYVLDLGASPGSWMQYVSKKIGEQGKVIGIDLKPIEVKLPNTICITGDMTSINVETIVKKNIGDGKFDAVISDMAPNTTGNKFVDQARSFDLCSIALETAKKFLKAGGHFVCKIFDGEDAMQLNDEIKKLFKENHILRPKSVQSSSKEMFLIGKFYNG